MSSNAAKKEGLNADRDDSNSASSGPENNDKQPHMRRSDSLSTTNEPSSASATEVSTAVTRHPTPRSGLPTFADAAAAAAPTVPLKEKKPRRAGFREQFLQKLRVMLDIESQNDSTTVRWSTDGNSFIITDHTQFEHIIPTYFDNPIVFASFLSKLYRWGFNRVSRSRRAGRYEFCSPTFKRLDSHSEQTAATATAAADTTGNAGGGASIQVQQQPAQAFSSSLQQDAMAPTNQLPPPNPLPTSQADANNAITDLISNLISNIQRQHSSSQQPSIPSQQSVLNQSTNNPLSMNHILQSFQERQHRNPTLNLLHTALSYLAGGQAPSLAQLMGHPSPSSQSNNAAHALMSLCGMMLPQPTLPNTNANTNTTLAMSQLLVVEMQRIVEEELERRAQVDAIHHAFILTIGQLVGGNNMIDEVERQRGSVAALGQTHGSTGETTAPNVSLGPGTTVRVPYSITAQLQQVGAPPPPPPAAGNQNIQADSIAAILQAARRGDVAGQLEDDDHARNGPDNGDNEDGNDDREGRQLTQRKRKSLNDDQYDADDDSWTQRLRPRKKSPRKYLV